MTRRTVLIPLLAVALVATAVIACQQDATQPVPGGLEASKFRDASLSGIRLAPSVISLKYGDSVTVCAFPVFATGQVGIGVNDHPVCDFAYSRLGLRKWQTTLSAEQQGIVDTLCIAFTVPAGAGPFTPADSTNCGVSVMPLTARLMLTLRHWTHRVFG